MPTYTVKYSNLKIKEKKKIAKIITSTHSKITGANNFFAQVIFEKNSIKSLSPKSKRYIKKISTFLENIYTLIN